MRDFLTEESGAVTTDWVALVAGILLLGMLVVYAVFDQGVATSVEGVNDELDGVEILEPGPQPNISG